MSLRVVAGLIVLLVMALLLLVSPYSSTPSVSAAPLAPHVVFGQARTVSGTILGSGLTVEARVNNIHYGQSVNASTGLGSRSTVTHSIDNNELNYGSASNFQICADDPGSSPLEGATENATVTFYVNGILAQVQRVGVDNSPVASLAFHVGSADQRVDLIIPSLTASKAAAATASGDACTTVKPASAPTATPQPAIITSGGGGVAATPTPEEFLPGAAVVTEPSAEDEAENIVGAGAAAGASLANLALDSPDVAASAIGIAFAEDPDSAIAALLAATESNVDAAGALLVASVAEDVETAAKLLNAAASADAAVAGLMLAAAAAADSSSAASAVISAYGLDVKAAAGALAQAAKADPVAVGQLILAGADANLGVMALALLGAAQNESKAVAEALVKSAGTDVSTTASLFLSAGENDASATGDLLVSVAGVDAGVAGAILINATQTDKLVVGSILAYAAASNSETVGEMLASASAVDSSVVGTLLITSGAVNSKAVGNALAEAANDDSVSIGYAIGAAAVEEPAVTGDLLTSAVSRNAVAIGSALGTASSGNPGPVGEALASGPAEDQQALLLLGNVIPVDPWMPENAPVAGSAPSGDGVWQNVAPSASTAAVLVRYVSEITGAGLDITDVLEANVTAPLSGRVVNRYMSLDPVAFSPSDVEAAHVSMAIDKSWLTSNQIHQWSIQFNRFDAVSGEWRIASAKRVSEDSDQVHFSIGIGGFSTWAISGGTEAPALQFRVSDFNIPDNNVRSGESVTIDAEVTNLTGGTTEYEAVLWINSQVQSTQRIVVGKAATVPFSFEVSAGPGRYDVRIDRHLGSFTVGIAPTATPTRRPAAVATATPTPIPPPRVIPPPIPTATPTPIPVLTATPTVAPKPVSAVPTAVIAKVEDTPTATAIPPTEVPPTVEAPTPQPTAIAVLPDEEAGSPLVVILIAVVVLLVLGGAAALFVLRGRGEGGQP